MRPLNRLLSDFPVSVDTGLSAQQVFQSRQLFGANHLTPLPRESLWKKFLEKFDEPIIKILLAAALLSMIVDLFRPPFESLRFTAGGIAVGLVVLAITGAYLLRRSHLIPSLLFLGALLLFPIGLATGHASFDGLAVMLAVILATGVAFASEYKSDREFEILNAQKESLEVKLLRGGDVHALPLEEVVVGDLVLLEMGDEIPADGRVVKATEMYVDQSLMTGESEPVRKHARLNDDADGPEQAGCLYRGTQVVDGVGQMIVTEVGDETYLGEIARRLSAHDEREEEKAGPDNERNRIKHKLTVSKELTPLQLKLQNLAQLISKVGYAAAIAIFLALLIRGIIVGEVRWPGPHDDFAAVLLDSAANLLGYFMYMVIIIVVAVPEGLPMSVTVSLALAMRKMTRANSLVRQLVACETIGSATVICSDKTGTLTQNKMRVVRVGWDGMMMERGAPNWVFPLQDVARARNGKPSEGKPMDWIALNAAVNSTAHLEFKDGEPCTVGNSTEGALLQWLHEGGLEYARLRLDFEPLYQMHFSSERKRMTTVIRIGDRLAALVKGAPEWLLGESTHYLDDNGQPVPWTETARTASLEQLARAAGQAMRTLAFGFAWLAKDQPADEESLHARRDQLENGLVFIGFVAIRDPLRDDVKDAVSECRRAGIEVKMITGDNLETALAIGGEIGLLDRPDALVLTSAEFNNLSDEQLKECLPRLRILARARPLDKLRMVKHLQELGEVVAVTGDGTNDAPALKKADVGLAMGRTGTEVAKEASKIVLLDDAFSTIVKAVHWGRSLYENIQRFIQFQLTINVSALAIAFLGPFFGVKPPFTILQLLWINVIMDTLASIALCSEPPRPGLMDMKPKRKDENILTRDMMQTILTTAIFFIVVMMALLLGLENGWCLRDPSGTRSKSFPELSYWQVAVFFSIYVLFQVWNEVNCRSLTPKRSGLVGMLRNPVFLGIVGLIVIGQVLIVSFGGEIFEVAPLSVVAWLGTIAFTASVLVFAEIARRVRLRMNRG
ncbi:MAG: cation-translocating P-type ATPase [Planctomycetes bacterium]|nr:cation-translocating P-type ATPase [Planctomycetota bacterium]